MLIIYIVMHIILGGLGIKRRILEVIDKAE